MQFAARLLALSAAITHVLAKVQLTNAAWDVSEGSPFEITWDDANGPVSLYLKTGASTDLSTVATIGSGLTGTSYTWTPSDLPTGTYAIEINDSTDTNYGLQFSYAGTAASTTSTTLESTTTAASSTTSGSKTTSDSTTSPSSSPSSSSSSTTTSSASSTLSTSTVTGSSNGTSTASSTSSKGSATKTSSSTTSTSTPLNTNDGQKMGSPLALVLLTVAALMLCH